jgi:hypothetical protein
MDCPPQEQSDIRQEIEESRDATLDSHAAAALAMVLGLLRHPGGAERVAACILASLRAGRDWDAQQSGRRAHRPVFDFEVSFNIGRQPGTPP